MESPNTFETAATEAVLRLGLRRAAYSVKDAMQVMSIGRASLYAAIKAGDLRPGKLGAKTLIYADDIARYLTKLRKGAPTTSGPSTPSQAA